MSTATAYFDTRAPLMTAANEAGAWDFAYAKQVVVLESLLRPGMTVLDVGCGPRLPYRADDVYVIGLDPSAASLAANTDVDERIVGTAESIPLPSHSVDLVVAFYALHHMTGQTARETHLMRSAALSEMWRVTKYDGHVLVFEMAPWPLAALAQRLLWPSAKRLLGDRLDAYFWGDADFAKALPLGGLREFDAPPFSTFPPIFSLPWLKIPRFLYPMTPTLCRWRV